MCSLKIEDYLVHMRAEHSILLQSDYTTTAVPGPFQTPSSPASQPLDCIMMDPVIIRLKAEDVAGAEDDALYFLMIGYCINTRINYTCIHLGPSNAPVLNKHKLEVQLKSQSEEVHKFYY